ncbi:MAG: helix-turn-helix domain-containing protein [Candidatus Omnitrophota bacterium]
MAEEKLLTIRDAALLLGISEKEVMDLAESGKLPAYKIGGVYLRFKRTQLEEFRKTLTTATHHTKAPQKYTLKEQLSDFLYFNDFYILSFLLILLIVFLIFR